MSHLLGDGSDWVVKLHRRGNLQGLNIADNLERVSKFPSALGQAGGLHRLDGGVGEGGVDGLGVGKGNGQGIGGIGFR